MHGITLLLIAAIGVDVGWKPTENGELEYIIQIAPEQLQALKTGDVIEVGVRPMLRSVRRYRIVVGTDPLPRQSARPTTENGALEADASKPASVLTGAVEQNQSDSAQLQLPDPPVPQRPLEDRTKSLDHSIMIKSEDSQKAPDPRWVAATDEYPSIQLQPIPTQPIPPSTAAATSTEDALGALPPPPEATVRPAPDAANVEMSAPRGTGDPFTPDYRKREFDDDEETVNREEYHLGDSVPIEQRAMQTSGTVPPTPRLMLPPPPDVENSSTISRGPLSIASSQPPPQTPSQEQAAQQGKLSLPLPPQIEQDSNVEQPPVIKTSAAPREEVLEQQDQDNDALHEPHAPSVALTNPPPSITASEHSSGGVWLTLALFASLGGNLFLGYVAWDIRKRFLIAFGREESSNREVESQDASTSPVDADPHSDSHP